MACETPLYPPASFPSRNIFSHPQNLNLNFLAEAEVGIAPKAETCLVFPAHILIFAPSPFAFFASDFLFYSAARLREKGVFTFFGRPFRLRHPRATVSESR